MTDQTFSLKIPLLPLNRDQSQHIKNATKSLNLRLQSRGMPSVSFLSLSLCHSKNDSMKSQIFDLINTDFLYDYEQKIITIINSLLKELDLSHDQLMTQELVIKEKDKLSNSLNTKIGKSNLMVAKNDKKITNLESEVLKLQLQVTDLKEKKTAMKKELREFKGKLNIRKENTSIKKLNLLQDDVTKNRNLIKSTRNITKRHPRAKKLVSKEWNYTVNEIFSETNILKIFLQNTYNCLLQLKETHGLSSVPQTFIPNNIQECASLISNVTSLSDIDAKLIDLIRHIQQESFSGSDDTFKFQRMGAERQKEILLLKNELKLVRESYERVIIESNLNKVNENAL